jgi:SAM-dependent methyltransferase
MASSSQGRHKVGVSIRRIVAHLSRCYPRSIERDTAMAERTADVQAHWTRPGVLARIDAALTELGHDPENLSPEILATVEHLHSGGLATTRDQAKRIAVTDDSRVLDVGCGIGGPARYLAHNYGCRVEGIDLTPELIETGRVLTERCKLADRVVLQVGNALDLPYPDQAFDVVWCQNVSMNRGQGWPPRGRLPGA